MTREREENEKTQKEREGHEGNNIMKENDVIEGN